MFKPEYLTDFWLYYAYVPPECWANHDARGYIIGQGELGEPTKPDVKSWYERDAGFGIATDQELTNRQREQFTKHLANELDGLIDIQRAGNRRILSVQITPAGIAKVIRLHPQLAPETTDERLERRTLSELGLQIEKAGRHKAWLREHMQWLRKRDGKRHPTNPVEWAEFQAELKQVPVDIKRIRDTLKQLQAGQITAKQAGRLFDDIYY